MSDPWADVLVYLKQCLLPEPVQDGIDLEIPSWLVRDAVAALEDRNALLVLKDYAVHDEACAFEGKEPDEWCTCGFSKALAALPEHLKPAPNNSNIFMWTFAALNHWVGQEPFL